MTLLAVAVTFVGLLSLLDLALTIGVIRRLREHSALLPGPIRVSVYLLTGLAESVVPITVAWLMKLVIDWLPIRWAPLAQLPSPALPASARPG